MKLSEFILLDKVEKQHTVLHKGVLVAKRRHQTGFVFLFRLNHYYVEIWCRTSNHSVMEYRVFDGTAMLEPYLKEISIPDLLQ